MSEADAIADDLRGPLGRGDAAVAPAGLAPCVPATAPRRVVRSRHRDRDFALRRALLVADLLGVTLALALCLLIAGRRGAPLVDAVWVLPTLPFWAFLFRAYGLYRRPLRQFEPTHLDDVGSLLHAVVIGTLGLWLAYKLAPPQRLSFEEVVIFGLLALPLVATLRVALRMVNVRLRGPERVFAIAPPHDVSMLGRKLRRHPEYEMELVGAVTEGSGDGGDLGLSLAAELDAVEDLVGSGEVDHVIVRLDADYIPQERVAELMRACHREGVRFGYFPGAPGLLPPGVDLNHLEGMGVLSCHPPVLSRTASALKRGLDLVVSALALALLALPLALLAAAIKLTSNGPALFRQQRVGRDGRIFELVKFRTMVANAEELTPGLMAQSADPNWLDLEEDPRVTSVGRFLRHTSLDELPQLWNVLKGEMSLVGPRPLSRSDDVNVRGWQRHRSDLTPGITGYWQILGRNNIPFEEMLEIDYAYVASWSLWYDVKILLRTLPVVLLRRGVN